MKWKLFQWFFLEKKKNIKEIRNRFYRIACRYRYYIYIFLIFILRKFGKIKLHSNLSSNLNTTNFFLCITQTFYFYFFCFSKYSHIFGFVCSQNLKIRSELGADLEVRHSNTGERAYFFIKGNTYLPKAQSVILPYLLIRACQIYTCDVLTFCISFESFITNLGFTISLPHIHVYLLAHLSLNMLKNVMWTHSYK